MTKAIETKLFQEKTGKTWEEWIELLDKHAAMELTHTEIAHLVYKHIVASGVQDDTAANALGRQNPSGWWSQSVTVAYEQHIGRRMPGQRDDGSFEVSISKTLPGTMADAMRWWVSMVGDNKTFNGVQLLGEPRSSVTPVANNWRTDLSDGSKLLVSTSDKGPDKALFVVTVQKIPTARAAEHWRSFWKAFISSK